MNAKTTLLPDFIILGAMKCATSTLHVQLGKQAGVHVSTPKEPNFFSDDAVYEQGLWWYSSLFESENARITGESSTHYTKQPTYPLTIPRMLDAGISEKTKFIYMVRDPIDRLISHYLHEISEGNIRCDIETALDKHPELIDYSRYHFQINHYLESLPRAQIMLVFFERIKNHPQSELESISQFLGLDPTQVTWDTETKAQNVSAQRIKKFPLYSLIIESRLATSLRRILFPKSIRSWIRSQLLIKETRPTLSPAAQKKLKQIFDQDLSLLGNLAGLELNHDNYKHVSACSSCRLLKS